MSEATVVFAGDRDIAVDVLAFLRRKNVEPEALLLPEPEAASHDGALLEHCDYLEDRQILRGDEFREPAGRQLLSDLAPDYVLSIHFQYIYPREVLEIPAHGVVNLHPAYLPYNRGWHTPTWAIWDQTPYGATMHFMNEEVDAGDIIARREIEIRPQDTADSLYNRTKQLEFELFRDTWPALANFDYTTQPQDETRATAHRKDDLEGIQEIDRDDEVRAGQLLRRLRALTTNKPSEAAYFEVDGRRYRIQVDITPEGELE